MWIMTPYGFFSIVQVSPTDPNLLQIRARDRAHLVALRKAAMVKLPGITTTGGTDYPYRIKTTRELVGQIMIDLVIDIDYLNFKEEAHRVSPKDRPFHNFLMRVWSLGREMMPGSSGRNARRYNEKRDNFFLE